MPKASELKPGSVVEINGEPYAVKSIDVRNPTSRGASTLYKIRFFHVKTRQKLDNTLKGDVFFKEADCSRILVQFSYQDADEYHFMDQETYEMYSLNSAALENQVYYLTESLPGIIMLLLDDTALGIELPTAITMEVIESPPAMKGASATNRTKPAKLATGLEIQVPEYIESGDRIKVNSDTGKFMSRA